MKNLKKDKTTKFNKNFNSLTKRYKTNKYIAPKEENNPLDSKNIIFSWKHFDSDHNLFNFGGINSVKLNSLFLELLKSLQEVSSMDVVSVQQSSKHQMHTFDWKNVQADKPNNLYTHDNHYQFRVNKSKGRVIGELVDNVFFIHWIDFHHNFTNVEGYRKSTSFKKLPTETEELLEKNKELEKKLSELQKDYDSLQRILYGSQQKSKSDYDDDIDDYVYTVIKENIQLREDIESLNEKIKLLEYNKKIN